MKARNEEDILKSMAINTIKEVLSDATPTRKELKEYSTIQAEKCNFNVEEFVRLVETEIPFQLEIGKRI